jgi:hypothetical protein
MDRAWNAEIGLFRRRRLIEREWRRIEADLLLVYLR